MRKEKKDIDFNKITLPVHIGIIMDGNGRWAKKRALPRSIGHKKGAETFRNIVRHCNKRGIKYLTVYAFSTENWKRPQNEIDAILDLLRDYLNDAKNHKEENVKTKFIGNLSVFDKDIIDLIADCEEESNNFTGLNLNIAINYGGREEITNALKIISQKVLTNKIDVDEISENLISQNLYTKGQPDVDLIIRPSGEQRLSNFLLWQCAYAEYIFMDVLWPDFDEKLLDDALVEFSNRNRRFGGI
ncbi:MAG: isoprenyl transferase [Oscillospiraceae bacterium]